MGDWGLGIGDWAQSPIPNPQSPIPNPQSPYLSKIDNILLIKKIKLIIYFFYIKNIFKKLIKKFGQRFRIYIITNSY